jgi:hypothetical protein
MAPASLPMLMPTNIVSPSVVVGTKEENDLRFLSCLETIREIGITADSVIWRAATRSKHKTVRICVIIE